MMYDDSCLIGMFNFVEKRPKMLSTNCYDKFGTEPHRERYVRWFHCTLSSVFEQKKIILIWFQKKKIVLSPQS